MKSSTRRRRESPKKPPPRRNILRGLVSLALGNPRKTAGKCMQIEVGEKVGRRCIGSTSTEKGNIIKNYRELEVNIV